MALLDRESYRELHIIRRIRNEFGHQYKAMTFDVPAIKNRCNELKRMPRAQRRNGNSNVVPIDLGRNFCDPGSDQSWRQCKLGELRVRPANAEQKSYGALPFSLRRRSPFSANRRLISWISSTSFCGARSHIQSCALTERLRSESLSDGRHQCLDIGWLY